MKLNIFGPVTMRTGYGVAVVNLTAALSSKTRVTLTPRTPPQEDEIQRIPEVYDALIAGRDHFDYSCPSLNIWHASGLQSFTGALRIGMPIFEGTRFRPEERNHLANLDAMFLTSKWAENIVQENMGEDCPPTFVTRLGYNPAIFYDAETLGIQGIQSFPAPRAVNIGKWEKRKGHPQLIRVLGKLKPPMTLFAAWDNPFYPGWKQMCVQLLIDNKWQQMESPAHWRAGDCHLVLTSWVDTHVNYAEFLRTVDFCIFPYRAEGWCLPLLECMACGLPFIATHYSAPTEYLTDDKGHVHGGVVLNKGKMKPIFDQIHFQNGGYGDWFVPYDEELEEAIEFILNSDMKKMGKHAAKWAQNFTWEKSALFTLKALEKLNA